MVSCHSRLKNKFCPANYSKIFLIDIKLTENTKNYIGYHRFCRTVYLFCFCKILSIGFPNFYFSFSQRKRRILANLLTCNPDSFCVGRTMGALVGRWQKGLGGNNRLGDRRESPPGSG
jgi:hypothetical protein